MVARRRPLGTVEPRLGAIRIQTSAYGLAIAKIYGRCRVPGNLLWYGGFKAIPQEERAETGKGGSPPSRVYYVYSADVMMALGEGPISGVRRIWKGKQLFDGGSQTTAERHRRHHAVVPSNGIVAVPLDGGTFVEDVLVRMPSPALVDGADEMVFISPRDLTAGVHYAVAAGVYTINVSSFPWLDGALLDFDYLVEETVSARSALEELGLVLSPGTYSQPMWPHLLQTYPAEALAYPGIAYVRGREYPLSSAAEIENHTFEVDGALQVSSSNPDCVPADVVYDILTNEHSGVQMPGEVIGSMDAFRAYTNGIGMWISLAANEQRPARMWIGEILDATNTDPCWDGQQLRFIPRGDENVGSYVAPNTPVMEIGPDQIIGRIKAERRSQSSVKTSTKVEYCNRENAYAFEIAEYRDEAAEIDYGKRPGDPYAWHFICDGEVARRAAMVRGQRDAATRNTYTFAMPGGYIEIQPGDLVLLNDPKAGINGVIARVTKIREGGKDSLEFEAEDFPIAHANAPAIPPELGAGFQMNQNADPGLVTPPIFVEPPGGYTETGLEVWIAVAGQNDMWGGCDVYCSLDGQSYKQLGTIEQSARCGRVRVSSAAGAVGPLRIEQHGRAPVLRSFSAADADALRSLCYVGDPDNGEYLAYEAGDLVGAGQYDLYGLRRGRYTTTDQAHAANEPFVVVDGALGTSGPLDRELIGKKIWFKFPSHNVFGGGVQSLATVPAYEYTIRGRFVGLKDRPMPANLLPNSGFEYDASGYNAFSYSSDTVRLVKNLSASAIKGVPTSAYVEQTGTSLAGQPAGGANSILIACEQNKRYGVASLLRSVHCQGWLAIAFGDENGQFAGQKNSTLTTLRSTDSTNPADYELKSAFMTAPPSARQMLIQFGKYGTAAGHPRSWMHVFQPRVFEVIGADQVPPWSPGPNGVVGTLQLTPGAATQMFIPPVSDEHQTVTYYTPRNQSRTLYEFTPSTSGDLEVTFTVGVTCTATTEGPATPQIWLDATGVTWPPGIIAPSLSARTAAVNTANFETRSATVACTLSGRVTAGVPVQIRRHLSLAPLAYYPFPDLPGRPILFATPCELHEENAQLRITLIKR